LETWRRRRARRGEVGIAYGYNLFATLIARRPI